MTLPSQDRGREAPRRTEFNIITTWHNAGPHTIWGQLAIRLGREPTNAEARDEVLRILRDDPVPTCAVGSKERSDG